jgi:hypothetical protein
MSDNYAEAWDRAEQVIYDNEQRIAELETELVALRARAEAAEGMREALDWGIRTLEVAVAAGLDDFSDEDVKDIVANHKTLGAMRAALDAYDKSKGG